jgi:hypothetical protein
LGFNGTRSSLLEYVKLTRCHGFILSLCSGLIASPTDNIMSPVTAKLAGSKQRHFMKYVYVYGASPRSFITKAIRLPFLEESRRPCSLRLWANQTSLEKAARKTPRLSERDQIGHTGLQTLEISSYRMIG